MIVTALRTEGNQRYSWMDDKIELNWRINETLEAIVRSLFKSWFVDFNPLRSKVEGFDSALAKSLVDLFPTRLVDSEIGEIPDGWKVGRFADVAEQLRDQENPLASPDVLFRHFSIPAFDEGQWPKTELGKNIKSLKSRVIPGVILLSKLNPEIERVWLVDVEAADRAVCSTEFLVIRPRFPYGRSYLYCLARSPCACSVSVLFGVPRCLPPRLSPGFEPPPGMVSGYFCCQWLLAGI